MMGMMLSSLRRCAAFALARLRVAGVCLALPVILGGCAMVSVKPLSPQQYVAAKRGDLLNSDMLSDGTTRSLRMLGLEADDCRSLSMTCLQALQSSADIDDEDRLSALAELWLLRASLLPKPVRGMDDPRIEAWLQAARHAYAYLFFTQRTPEQRAFEDRQTQVKDYYNYAVQEAATGLFHASPSRGRRPMRRALVDESGVRREGNRLLYPGWNIIVDLDATRWEEGREPLPLDLVAATSLTFSGLRHVYRRDGFGAELVAVMEETPDDLPFRAMPSPTLTVLLQFHGSTLQQVLDTNQVELDVYDPYQQESFLIDGRRVPLAANYTAGYGLWLARAGFASESVRTLLGREGSRSRPLIYLMQPYDPERRVLLLLHGLASSPEAWVNLANDLSGDALLRQHYQIWQAYYPTNLPLAMNRQEIESAVRQTLDTLDPGGTAQASRDMVLIGHSMGGVLARLLVSDSQNALWDWLRDRPGVSFDGLEETRASLAPMMDFRPMPNVTRAIFLAAPHQGTTIAGHGLAQMLARLVSLPVAALQGMEDIVRRLGGNRTESAHGAAPAAPEPEIRIPTSVDNLNADDSFVQAAAHLPISPNVRYHSIIARNDLEKPLDASDDGLVPYWSAHLPGAVSETTIVSGHSVQETPQAIQEIRRILREDVAEHTVRSFQGPSKPD